MRLIWATPLAPTSRPGVAPPRRSCSLPAGRNRISATKIPGSARTQSLDINSLRTIVAILRQGNFPLSERGWRGIGSGTRSAAQYGECSHYMPIFGNCPNRNRSPPMWEPARFPPRGGDLLIALIPGHLQKLRTTTMAKMRRDGTLVEVLADGAERPFPGTPMRPITEAEIQAAALTDPIAQPLSDCRRCAGSHA
jgi:hypothetical protein